MESSETNLRLGYQPALDGLRGVAVALVVLRHLYTPFAKSSGDVGVAMFFGLSGFLITTLLIEERARAHKVNFRGFYRRRFFRLAPALALALTLVITLSLAFHHSPPLRALVGAALYMGNYAQIVGGEFTALGHTWTLAIEEHFYLVWPLAFSLLSRRPLRQAARWVAVAALLVSVWRVTLLALGASAVRVQFGTDTRIDGILVGCAAAMYFYGRWPRVPRVLVLVATATLTGLAFLPPRGTAMLTVGVIVAPAAAVLIILHTLTSNGVVRSVLEFCPLTYLGLISYGLYLFHVPIFEYIGPHIDHSLLIRAPILVGTSIVAASVSFFAVERPLLRSRSGTRSKNVGSDHPKSSS